MGMEMKLQPGMRQEQTMTITPQLVQAIRLLQLNGIEMERELNQELADNPILADERTDPRALEASTDKTVPTPTRNEAPPEERIGETERLEMDTNIASRAEEKKAQELDWEQLLENRTLQQALPSGKGGTGELPPIEQNHTALDTLQAHLLAQLPGSHLIENERRFAYLIIHNLDERGYLDLSGPVGPDDIRGPDLTLEQLAEEAGLDPEDAEAVLEEIQRRFDPIGIASRTLEECWLVQVAEGQYGREERALIEGMIRDHLDKLEKNKVQAIAKAMKVPIEDVHAAVAEIRQLERNPARNFMDQDERSLEITPDVYVHEDGDSFMVSLHDDERIPNLYVNAALERRMIQDPRAKEFTKEKLRSATWVQQSLEKRRRTIRRVTECIVEKQSEFLRHGVAYLKPMILRDVAETVGMHESTISRVTSNKYVHTPQGLFELKYFFNSSIHRVDGAEDIASESVKQAIKRIVEGEDGAKPYSDQTLVAVLKAKEGIDIARRTVAKYRDILRIPPSSLRKKTF